MPDPLRTLKKTFGYSEFRPLQREIIKFTPGVTEVCLGF